MDSSSVNVTASVKEHTDVFTCATLCICLFFCALKRNSSFSKQASLWKISGLLCPFEKNKKKNTVLNLNKENLLL